MRGVRWSVWCFNEGRNIYLLEGHCMLQSVRWAHGHFQLINTEYLVHLVAFTQVFIDWQTAIFAKHFCANNAILS